MRENNHANVLLNFSDPQDFFHFPKIIWTSNQSPYAHLYNRNIK